MVSTFKILYLFWDILCIICCCCCLIYHIWLCSPYCAHATPEYTHLIKLCYGIQLTNLSQYTFRQGSQSEGSHCKEESIWTKTWEVKREPSIYTGRGILRRGEKFKPLIQVHALSLNRGWYDRNWVERRLVGNKVREIIWSQIV
jgi:hypothetical protein